VAAFRSRRLEAQLGANLDDLDHGHVAGLVTGQVPEAFDLDYKSQLYGGTDKDRRDLATDVAALANTAGGLLILGVEEDNQAQACAIPGVDISDTQQRRIVQIVGGGVLPLPVVEVKPLEEPGRPGHGVLVIAVPRSPLAPHAVIVNDGLRYPLRSGSTTRYLTEPEVADAYRRRFASSVDRLERAQLIEKEAVARLDTDRAEWLVVSIVPDFSGEYVVDLPARNAFQAEIVNTSPAVIPYGLTWTRASVGRRRLLADGATGDDPRARYLSSELHDDGAGVFAAVVAEERRDPVSGATPPLSIGDEAAVNVVMSGLRFLGSHARDRAAATGDALVRVFIYPMNPRRQIMLSHGRFHGVEQQLGAHILTGPENPAERVLPLDSIATAGPELLSASYLLLTELFQAFGWPEVVQVTREGVLRRRYWNAQLQGTVVRWAELHGIEVTDETV